MIERWEDNRTSYSVTKGLLPWTAEEKQEMLEFARAVVPPRWFVHTDSEDGPQDARLSIHLDIRDPETFRFVNSFPVQASVGAQQYRGGVGLAYMVVNPMNYEGRQRNWRLIFLEELAHVAVYHWVAFKNRVHRQGNLVTITFKAVYYHTDWGPPVREPTGMTMHGVEWRKAYRTFKARAYRKGLVTKRMTARKRPGA